jgi:DNA repair photolyase
LAELARHQAAAVTISLTTLDGDLAARLEPRTSQPTMRLEAMARLREAGVPVGVLVAPVIPAINDHEIPAVLKAAAAAGVQFAGYTVVRLPHGVKDLFTDWLTRHFPDRRDKVLGRIRDLRGGKLNDSSFGKRMTGEGIWADQIAALFDAARRKSGLAGAWPPLSTAAFRRPVAQQSPGQREFEW